MRLLFTASAIGIGGVAIASLLGWARAKGLALALHPAGLGTYGQLATFVLYAGTASGLGLGLGATRLIAAARETRSEADLAAISTCAVAIPAALGTVLLLVSLAVADGVAAPLLGIRSATAFAIGAISIPFVAVQTPLQHVIQGFEDVTGQVVAYLVYNAAFTAIAVAGAYVAGVEGAAVGLTVGNVLLAALYLARAHVLLQVSGSGFGVHALMGIRGEIATPLIAIGVSSLVVTVTYSAADLTVRTALLHSHGRAATGLWYAMLLLCTQFIGALTGAATYILAPLVSRASAAGDASSTTAVLDDSVRLVFVVVAPLLVVISAFRSPVSVLLFSTGFRPMAQYLPVQMIGELLRSLAWAIGTSLIPLKLTRAWVAISVASSILFLSIGGFASARWGLGGATAAWMLTWGVSLVAEVGVLARLGIWRPTRRMLAAWTVAAMAIGVAGCVPLLEAAAAAVAGSGLIVWLTTTQRERIVASQWIRSVLVRS